MADETIGPAAASNAQENPSGPLPAHEGAPSESGAPSSIPATPAPAPVYTPEERMGADIARILKEVKLPEHRDAPVSGEHVPKREVKNIDAMLSAEATVPRAPEPPPLAAGTAPVSGVHTLKQDLQGVVREQKISIVRAVALEEDRRITDTAVIQPAQKPHSEWGKQVILGGLLLLALGGAALGGVYLVMSDRAARIPVQLPDSLLFSENTRTLALDDQSPTQVKSTIERARATLGASFGSITRIVPTYQGPEGQPRPVTLSEFLTALGTRPPERLLRALGDTFFFGLHAIDKNAPVLLLEVASYENAFAGMLEWEGNLNADLIPAYTAVPALIAGEGGLLQRRAFRDDVMRNFDVRELKDDSGAIVLYYAFPTRDLLFIAESPYSFTEVLNRLQAQQGL